MIQQLFYNSFLIHVFVYNSIKPIFKAIVNKISDMAHGPFCHIDTKTVYSRTFCYGHFYLVVTRNELPVSNPSVSCFNTF